MNECRPNKRRLRARRRRRDDVEALRADLREAEVDPLVRRVRGADDRSPASAWRDQDRPRRVDGAEAQAGQRPRDDGLGLRSRANLRIDQHTERRQGPQRELG